MEPGRPGQRLEAEFQFLGLGHRGRGLGQKRISVHLSVKFGLGAECPQRGWVGSRGAAAQRIDTK